MILPVSNIQNVLRTYGRQLNIARLISEEKRQVTQGQVDRVEISEEAKRMLDQKPQTTAPDMNRPVKEAFAFDEFESETVETNENLKNVEDDDFNF